MTLAIACIQLTSGPDIAANIQKIDALIARAAKAGAKLVALPENAFEMAAPKTPRMLYTEDKHPAVAAASAMAKKYRCWLLAGSIAVLKKKGTKKTYNRSLLFNPQGKIDSAYNKIHLFDVDIGDGQEYRESDRIRPGKKAVLAETSIGNIGMTVCYDLRFPQLFRALAKKGAHIIAVPSAFTQKTGEAHWHVLLRARAIENGCFIIAPAQCGTHAGGRRTYGHSLIIDPWGRVLADGGAKEGIVSASIDLREVRRIRASLPSLEHDRAFSLKR